MEYIENVSTPVTCLVVVHQQEIPEANNSNSYWLVMTQ